MKSHLPGFAGATAGGLFLKEKMEKAGHKMGHRMQKMRAQDHSGRMFAHDYDDDDDSMRSHLPGLAGTAAGGLYLKEKMEKMRHKMGHRTHRMRTRDYDNPLFETETHTRVKPKWGGLLASLAVLAAGTWFLSKQMRKGAPRACSVYEAIELEVPVSTAYNQWTQFEEFPRFMDSVESVRQVDDTHLHWRARVGGKMKEWDVEITEQIPDKRIAWRSVSGPLNGGVVTFHHISANRTRVMLQMDYTPETFTERAGDMVGAVKHTARSNLKRFKQLVEQRGVETGGWRGTVEHGTVTQH